MKYLPFIKGIYSTSPSLVPMNKAERATDKLVFQIDEHYNDYLANKQACRVENIHKYYCEERLFQITAACINKYIAGQLLKEHPVQFSLQNENGNYILTNHKSGEILLWKDDWLSVQSDIYLSLFDALSCQVQEDLVICQLDNDKDWLSALHLCAPNHWAATEKAGRPFDVIHKIVPGMEQTISRYFNMLLSIINKGPFTRFAWGIATDMRLNHHPETPPGFDPDLWTGRKFEESNEGLYLRVERQNLIGFPAVNAFLFTIRTYFYDVDLLKKPERAALLKAIESMPPESLEYKGLSGKMGMMRERLL